MDSSVSHGIVVVVDKKSSWCEQNRATGSNSVLPEMIIGKPECLNESGKHRSHECGSTHIVTLLLHGFLNNFISQCYFLPLNYYYIFMHVCLCIKKTTNFVQSNHRLDANIRVANAAFFSASVAVISQESQTRPTLH